MRTLKNVSKKKVLSYPEVKGGVWNEDFFHFVHYKAIKWLGNIKSFHDSIYVYIRRNLQMLLEIHVWFQQY